MKKFALLSAALVFALSSGAQAQKLTQVKLQLKWFPQAQFAGFFVAQAKGYYKAEGLDVKLLPIGDQSPIQTVATGTADFGTTWITDLLTARQQGIPVVHIAQLFQKSGFTLVSLKTSNITKPADLKGKRIGVSAPGSSTNQAVNYMLAKAGVSPKDVSIIGVGQSAGAVAAIESGEIDALIINDPAATLLKQSGNMKPLADFQSREGTRKVFGGDYPEASLYTKQSFVDANPNTVQALTTAIVKAEHWMAKATPAEIWAKVPAEYRGKNQKEYEQALQNSRACISTDGMMDPAGPKVVEDVLATALPNIKGAHVDLSKTYTNRFVVEANKELAK